MDLLSLDKEPSSSAVNGQAAAEAAPQAVDPMAELMGLDYNSAAPGPPSGPPNAAPPSQAGAIAAVTGLTFVDPDICQR